MSKLKGRIAQVTGAVRTKIQHPIGVAADFLWEQHQCI